MVEEKIRSKRFQLIVVLSNTAVIGTASLIGVWGGKLGLAFKEGELVTCFSAWQLGMCAVASGLEFL